MWGKLDMKLGGKINGWVFSVCTSIRIREKQPQLQQEKRRGESGIESDKCYWKVYVTSCHNRNYFHSQIYIGRNWLFTFVVVVFSLFFCLQFSLLTLSFLSLSLSPITCFSCAVTSINLYLSLAGHICLLACFAWS